MTSTASRIRLAQVEGDRLVNRLKNTNLDKFHTLCKMHLSFLLHLPGSSLDEFLSDGGATWGSGGITPSSEKPKFRHFGKKKSNKENKVPEQLPITHETIDQILPLIDYLNNECNLKQEGLFRKSGHIGRQKLLREKLQNGEDVRMELESGIYSAHDCASVLKAFLSDLQEPVLTEKHYLAHCQIPEMDQEDKQLQTLQLLLQLMPSENLFLLRCLLTLLQKVAQECENKMTSETLGTLFAPHLLVPRKMSPNELQAIAGDLTKTVAFMIDNAEELFKLPQPLIRDIATYWAQMETSSAESTDDHIDQVRLRYRTHANDGPIHTSITFADRQASQQAAAKTDTQIALAQLYAHVSSMPESAKKRRLLKQFNKANSVTMGMSPAPSSEKHKRTKSFGDSIKKIVSRNHRRRGSSHSLQIQQELQSQDNTPFSVNIGKYTSQSSQLLEKDDSTRLSDKHDDTRVASTNGCASNAVGAYKGPPLKLPLLPKSSVQMLQPSAVTSYIFKLRQRNANSAIDIQRPEHRGHGEQSSTITTPPSVLRPRSHGRMNLISPATEPIQSTDKIRATSSPLLGLVRRRSFKNKESHSPGSQTIQVRTPNKKNRTSDSPTRGSPINCMINSDALPSGAQ